jgi:hypothetical protein
MNKKYMVRLLDEERGSCQEVIKSLKDSSQKFHRAQILLESDADGPAWPDFKIAEAFNCCVQTIENLRKRLVAEGFDWHWRARNARSRPRLPSSTVWVKPS